MTNQTCKTHTSAGRRPDAEAVFWHYAYLRAVEGYLPYDINRQLTEAFDHAPRSMEEFTEFMRLARIFHLNFTAPITASFGTTYNITPGEYKELIRLRIYPDDPVQRDPEYDEIIDQFLYCLFDRKSPLNARSVASLKLRLSSDPEKIVFDDAMVDSLIDVLQRNRLKLKSAAEILQQLGSASHVDGKQAELEDLISQYNAIESESIELIAKEKKLAKVFTAGRRELAALPGPLAYFGLGVSSAVAGGRGRVRAAHSAARQSVHPGDCRILDRKSQIAAEARQDALPGAQNHPLTTSSGRITIAS